MQVPLPAGSLLGSTSERPGGAGQLEEGAGPARLLVLTALHPEPACPYLAEVAAPTGSSLAPSASWPQPLAPLPPSRFWQPQL